MHGFLAKRAINDLEWVSKNSYSRTIEVNKTRGYLTITAKPEEHYFELELNLNDYPDLNFIVQRIRPLFDIDAPIRQIDQRLGKQSKRYFSYLKGLRVPGIWNTFEAGVRAILGQQVSVAAANKLVTELVFNLGEEIEFSVTGKNDYSQARKRSAKASWIFC